MSGRAIDTVFLDRDGTINVRLVGEWIVREEQFELLPGVGEALAKLQRAGMALYVITNQRGIELGLFTEERLSELHAHMGALLAPFGVTLAGVYSSHVGKGPRTKPEPGMFFDAKRDHPEIDFSRSVMIGDAVRDVQAGAAAGCRTVLIIDAQHGEDVLREAREKNVRPDYVVRSLAEAAEIVLSLR